MADLKTTIKMAYPILYGISILSIFQFVAFQFVIDGIVLEYLALMVPELSGSLVILSSFLPLSAASIAVFVIIYLTKDIINKW